MEHDTNELTVVGSFCAETGCIIVAQGTFLFLGTQLVVFGENSETTVHSSSDLPEYAFALAHSIISSIIDPRVWSE
jgi:hypothetical protein